MSMCGDAPWQYSADVMAVSNSSIFFFNDPATTELYTLSLHDALPISTTFAHRLGTIGSNTRYGGGGYSTQLRSEEHTSELQSRGHLVCRLLLEKKKNMFRQADHRPPDRVQGHGRATLVACGVREHQHY